MSLIKEQKRSNKDSNKSPFIDKAFQNLERSLELFGVLQKSIADSSMEDSSYQETMKEMKINDLFKKRTPHYMEMGERYNLKMCLKNELPETEDKVYVNFDDTLRLKRTSLKMHH